MLVVDGQPSEPTDPEAPNWPTKKYLRHQISLPEIGRIIYDGPCRYRDMPVAHSVYEPMDCGPWGMGVTWQVEPLQQFANQLATVLYNFYRYNAWPAQVHPSTLAEVIRQKGIAPGVAPNTEYELDDITFKELFPTGVGTGFSILPPPEPRGALEMLVKTLSIIDETMGNVDVLQGQPPSAAMSGYALGTMTANATAPIVALAEFLNESLRRFAGVVCDAIIDGMNDAEWAKALSQYPPLVAQVLRESISTREWDCQVDAVEAGDKGRMMQETLAKMQATLISKRTAQERIGENPELEDKREMDAQRRALSALQPPEQPNKSVGFVPDQAAQQGKAVSNAVLG
jgi:hypothetical protein